MTKHWPLIVSTCADCSLGTIRIGEWHMVHGDVWEQAWAGRRKSWQGRVPGTEILCIGCLERRIGRTLVASDFIPDVPANDPSKDNISDRMRTRLRFTTSLALKRKRGRPKGSKNRPKRKRGRPLGSRNKPKFGGGVDESVSRPRNDRAPTHAEDPRARRENSENPAMRPKTQCSQRGYEL